MTKRFLYILLAAIIPAAVMADPIDAEKAAALAAPYSSVGAKARLVHKARRAPGATPNTSPLYIFSRGENAGFVIVAGDDCVQPILGVTDSGDFDADNVAPSLNYFIEGWSEIITNAQAKGTNKSKVQAKAYGTKDVEPLMTALWDQGEPYNNRTPFVGSGVRHCTTGCVATQGAMLAYFWRDECYDCVQFDTPLYTCNGGQTIIDEETQIKAGTPYHWELMQDSYLGAYSEASADAVAVLMATLGMTSQLNYTQTLTGGSMDNLRKAMLQQVGLDGKFTYQNNRTNDEWAALILSNLNAGVPIGFGGVDGSGGGHAFICDGYRVSDNLFHFNFGFSGSQDGYYALLSGSDDDAGGWGTSQHILYDVAPLHPNLSATMQTTVLTGGDKNTISVEITNNSRLAYSGITLMLSQDVIDVASVQVTRKQDTTTEVAAGESGVLNFTFTPEGDKPYNYVVTDRCGGVIASGVLPVENAEPSTNFQPYVVRSLDQLQDNILYTLCLNTTDESRGFMSASSATLTSNTTTVAAKNRFLVFKTEHGCYLYSQTYKKFVSPKSKSLNAAPQGFFYLLNAETDNRWLLVNPLTDQCVQANSDRVVSYTALTSQNVGNQWLIEASAEADETIVATAKEVIANYEATLSDEIPATGITLSADMLNVCLGESATLVASVKPAAATIHDLTWTSSNEQVVTVADGVITTKGVGFAAITVTCGEFKAKCQVVVDDSYSRLVPTVIDQIDERVLYSIGTVGYGYLSNRNVRMGECARGVDGDYGLFLVIQGDKGFYLWNPASERFVPANGETTQQYPNGAFDVVASDVEGRWLFKNHNTPNVWMQSWYGYFRNYTEEDGNVPGFANRWLLHPEGIADKETLTEARNRIYAYENSVVHNIRFGNSNLVLTPGDVAALGLQVLPTTATGAHVTYESSDNSVVSINGTSMTAVALGTATITATCGDLTAKCIVSVKEPFAPYTVQTVGQLVEGDVYTFDLGDRGYLTFGNPTMDYGMVGTPGDNQRFLVLKGNKGYYIWNVAAGKFVPAKDNNVLDTPNGAFTISSSNTPSKWIVASTANGNWMQHGGASQFLINDSWKTQDAGNRWTIAAVGRVGESAYTAAKQAIADYEVTAGNAVTGISSIKEGTAYLLIAPRGSMLTNNGTLCGSCSVNGYVRDAADPYQQWGIIKLDGLYYLYNIGTDSFFGYESGDGIVPEPMQIVKQGSAFMLSDSDERTVNVGTTYTNGIAINDWFMPDDGNLFTICKTTVTYDTEAVKNRLNMALGIESPATAQPTRSNGIYDMQGRRVAVPGKGLYIINGKKVLVK